MKGKTVDELDRCEFIGCEAVAWRVLFWGPRMTGPVRFACWQHQRETDISQFHDREATSVTPPDGGRDA